MNQLSKVEEDLESDEELEELDEPLEELRASDFAEPTLTTTSPDTKPTQV